MAWLTRSQHMRDSRQSAATMANLLCSDQYAAGDYPCRLRHPWGGMRNLPATRREKCSILHFGSKCLYSKANLDLVNESVTVGADKQQFEREMVCMIENHRSFPCIVQWVVFNEGWGQYEVSRPGTPPKGLTPPPPPYTTRMASLLARGHMYSHT